MEFNSTFSTILNKTTVHIEQKKGMRMFIKYMCSMIKGGAILGTKSFWLVALILTAIDCPVTMISMLVSYAFAFVAGIILSIYLMPYEMYVMLKDIFQQTQDDDHIQ